MKIAANYYQQFDADHSLDVPAEGYGGWKKTELEISPERTALVVMHAWDTGTKERFPGWHRCVEYIPRAKEIASSVFPPLLSAVRSSKIKAFHVVGDGNYYKDLPGYKKAVKLAGPTPPQLETITPDPAVQKLRQFKSVHSFPGSRNAEDVERGFQNVDFMNEARPIGDEGVAENEAQLFALCKESGISHLIYVGFAINWCLLLSPGGMADMSKRGIMCSSIREAVTAVENKETARSEICKEIGLWRVALAFGFVFDLDDFLIALKRVEGG